jgi:tetratricopeptide (TPR) repeat protein
MAGAQTSRIMPEPAIYHTMKTFPILLVILSFTASSQQPGDRQQILAHAQQAQQFLRANQPDRAIPEFRAIIALDNANVDAHGNLGVLLYFKGDYALAIPELEAAVKLASNLWKTQALLGMAQKRAGDFDKAQANLEEVFPKVEEKDIQIQAGMELVEIYSRREQLDKAAQVLDLLHNKYPTDIGVLFASYRIYSDMAGEAMLGLSLLAPHSAQMYQVMAHELARQGQTDGAVKNYREALKVNPNLPGLHFELGEVLSSSGTPQDKEEAKKEYEAALAADPFDEKSECRLGTFAYQTGDLKNSTAHYSRAVQLQPDDAEANLDLAKDLIETNEIDKAQALVLHAIQIDPTSAEAHFRLAAIYRKQGRVEDAKHEIQEFQNLRDMKEKLRKIYQEMRLRPAQQEPEQGMGGR